MFSRQD